jgi:hypothetical protein
MRSGALRCPKISLDFALAPLLTQLKTTWRYVK